MTAEPYYVDPNTKKLVDGDRNRPGQANRRSLATIRVVVFRR